MTLFQLFVNRTEGTKVKLGDKLAAGVEVKEQGTWLAVVETEEGLLQKLLDFENSLHFSVKALFIE